MPSRKLAWPSRSELAALVRAARAAGPAAVDELLDAVRPSLTAYFARRFPSAEADDLAQAALVRIAGAVDRIDPERADHYVVTIARNVVRTEYRRRARESTRQVPLRFADAVESSERVDEEVEARELERAVRRASVETLPPPLRDVVLALLRGLSPAEIAEALQLNPVTVRTRLLRARSLLRHTLRPYLEDTDVDPDFGSRSPPNDR